MDLTKLFKGRDIPITEKFNHYYRTDSVSDNPYEVLDLIKRGSYPGRFFIEGDPHAACLYYPGQPLLEVAYSESFINDNNYFSRAFIDGIESVPLDVALSELRSLSVPEPLIKDYIDTHNADLSGDSIETVDGPLPIIAIPVLRRIYAVLRGKKHGGQVIISDYLKLDDLIAIYTCGVEYKPGSFDGLPSGYSPNMSEIIGVRLTNRIYHRGDSELDIGSRLLSHIKNF